MMEMHENNLSKAVLNASNVIAMSGKVVPATIDNVSIGAVLSDNTRAHGKYEIIEKLVK